MAGKAELRDRQLEEAWGLMTTITIMTTIGAVRNGIAAGSKLILDMEDVVRDDRLNQARFDEVRNLSQFVRNALALPASPNG